MALTDVTPRQSCIYVVPRSFDPRFPDPGPTRRRAAETFSIDDLVNVRALPAARGSLLGWNLGLAHWGSRPRRDAPSRISVAYYVQARTRTPLHTPCVDLERALPLATRLGLIGRQIAPYSRDRRPALLRLARGLIG